jgi:hypothetical protein
VRTCSGFKRQPHLQKCEVRASNERNFVVRELHESVDSTCISLAVMSSCPAWLGLADIAALSFNFIVASKQGLYCPRPWAKHLVVLHVIADGFQSAEPALDQHTLISGIWMAVMCLLRSIRVLRGWQKYCEIIFVVRELHQNVDTAFFSLAVMSLASGWPTLQPCHGSFIMASKHCYMHVPRIGSQQGAQKTLPTRPVVANYQGCSFWSVSACVRLPGK